VNFSRFIQNRNSSSRLHLIILCLKCNLENGQFRKVILIRLRLLRGRCNINFTLIKEVKTTEKCSQERKLTSRTDFARNKEQAGIHLYSVEKNDLHLVTFGIFAHVNFPVPLYFFSKYRTISSVNKCHESN
jgi:hypothetical protein